MRDSRSKDTPARPTLDAELPLPSTEVLAGYTSGPPHTARTHARTHGRRRRLTPLRPPGRGGLRITYAGEEALLRPHIAVRVKCSHGRPGLRWPSLLPRGHGPARGWGGLVWRCAGLDSDRVPTTRSHAWAATSRVRTSCPLGHMWRGLPLPLVRLHGWATRTKVHFGHQSFIVRGPQLSRFEIWLS